MNKMNLTTRRLSGVALLCIALALAGCGVSSPLPIGQLASSDSDDDTDEAPRRDPPADDGDEDEPPVANDDTSTGKPDSPRLPCGTGAGCDPTDLGGETCTSLGLGQGRLLCDPATCAYEVSLCQGSGVAGPCGTGAGCDAANLGGETCGSLGMGEGALLCDPVTCTFDTSLCSGGLFGAGGTGVPADDMPVEDPGTFGGIFGGTTGGIFGGTTGGIFGGVDEMDGGV